MYKMQPAVIYRVTGNQLINPKWKMADNTSSHTFSRMKAYEEVEQAKRFYLRIKLEKLTVKTTATLESYLAEVLDHKYLPFGTYSTEVIEDITQDGAPVDVFIMTMKKSFNVRCPACGKVFNFDPIVTPKAGSDQTVYCKNCDKKFNVRFK